MLVAAVGQEKDTYREEKIKEERVLGFFSSSSPSRNSLCAAAAAVSVHSGVVVLLAQHKLKRYR